jgi:hypothetical protein
MSSIKLLGPDVVVERYYTSMVLCLQNKTPLGYTSLCDSYSLCYRRVRGSRLVKWLSVSSLRKSPNK